MTNLFDAALDGDTPQVQALLGEHPDLVNAENERKRTALHDAAREGHAGTVRVLLEAGADPNYVVYPNKEITNPRTLADARGHEAAVAVFDQWVEEHLPSTASGLGTTLCAAVRAHDRGRGRSPVRAGGHAGDGRRWQYGPARCCRGGGEVPRAGVPRPGG